MTSRRQLIKRGKDFWESGDTGVVRVMYSINIGVLIYFFRWTWGATLQSRDKGRLKGFLGMSWHWTYGVVLLDIYEQSAEFFVWWVGLLQICFFMSLTPRIFPKFYWKMFLFYLNLFQSCCKLVIKPVILFELLC